MGSFKLEVSEQERASRFEKAHSSHSDTISYIFVVPRNGRGMIIKIKCNACSKSENITLF
jgi:hypothetical protein